jgi:hypothetical protein
MFFFLPLNIILNLNCISLDKQWGLAQPSRIMRLFVVIFIVMSSGMFLLFLGAAGAKRSRTMLDGAGATRSRAMLGGAGATRNRIMLGGPGATRSRTMLGGAGDTRSRTTIWLELEPRFLCSKYSCIMLTKLWLTV